NNDVVVEELSGDINSLYGRLSNLEPEALRKWLVDVSLAFHDKMINARSKSTKSFVQMAEQYVRDNYADESLSLDVICSVLNVSNSYFSTIFKKETGSSFVSYLTDYR